MPDQTKSSSDEPLWSRLVCHSLLCHAYDYAATQLCSKLVNLKDEHEKNGALEYHAEETQRVIATMRQLIKSKRALHKIPGMHKGAPEDAAALNHLEEMVETLEAKIHTPLKSAKKLTEPKRAKLIPEVLARAQMMAAEVQLHRQQVITRGQASAKMQVPLHIYLPADTGKIEVSSVISVDLYDYTSMAKAITELRDVEQLHKFNQQLIERFRVQLQKIDPKLAKVPIDPTGDGALIFVPNPTAAVNFAKALLDSLFAEGGGIAVKEWRKSVRIGIATGPVFLSRRESPDGTVVSFEAAGDTIIDAVRLQAKCDVQSIMICDDTRSELEKSLRDSFDPAVTIQAKQRTIKGCRYNHQQWSTAGGPKRKK